jgi:hypothetical protein
MRVLTGRLAPYRCNLCCRVAIVDEHQVVRNHLPRLSSQQSNGRHAMPHPKLDDRVRLSSQLPQLVTVFVDPDAKRRNRQLPDSQSANPFTASSFGGNEIR